jgi:N-acetyltransferase
MNWLKPLILSGNRCTLAPLAQDHLTELSKAVKDGKLWELWYTLIPKPENMQREVERRLQLQESGNMLPFTIIDNPTNLPIGMTTYLNIDEKNRRLEIGGTWLRKSKQRMGINTEAKYLLLTHAFEKLNCNAVEFRTHYCNQQSRRSIERLGAKLDGILRHHMIMPDGTLRDTCVYSIIAAEWPTVKSHLKWSSQKIAT